MNYEAELESLLFLIGNTGNINLRLISEFAEKVRQDERNKPLDVKTFRIRGETLEEHDDRIRKEEAKEIYELARQCYPFQGLGTPWASAEKPGSKVSSEILAAIRGRCLPKEPLRRFYHGDLVRPANKCGDGVIVEVSESLTYSVFWHGKPSHINAWWNYEDLVLVCKGPLHELCTKGATR